MFHAKKLMLSLTFLAAAMCLNQAQAARPDGIFCVIDVVVETRNQAGVAVGTETYHREFTLLEGGSFSDDFSTPTRLKEFDAAFRKANGEKIVSADWFADVTVFNSVKLRTSVALEGGDKRGKSTGEHTLFTSGGSTVTSYSLTCATN